jgi:peptidoglycan/xylan/chitin deacetylase (PgdA/CDA1 family)
MLSPGWYIALYHEVSWEEPPELRGIGGMTVPPDRFEDHLRALSGESTLLSVADARARLAQGPLDSPVVSIWFDDGYRGVRRYAAPRMSRAGVTGTISVCSRFTLRKEMFWRAQLARLASGDGLRFLRSRLRKIGIDPGDSLRESTLDRFTPELRQAIERSYRRHTSPELRQDAYRIFDTVEGLRTLQQSGWTMANHSASHWPIGEDSALESMVEQFTLAEQECATAGLKLSSDWVLPFDRERSTSLDQVFDAEATGKTLVLVGNRTTSADDLARNRIHRIVAPPCSGSELVQRLRRSNPVRTGTSA